MFNSVYPKIQCNYLKTSISLIFILTLKSSVLYTEYRNMDATFQRLKSRAVLPKKCYRKIHTAFKFKVK